MVSPAELADPDDRPFDLDVDAGSWTRRDHGPTPVLTSVCATSPYRISNEKTRIRFDSGSLNVPSTDIPRPEAVEIPAFDVYYATVLPLPGLPSVGQHVPSSVPLAATV